MAAKTRIKDSFEQFMRLNVTQSAANTLTFGTVPLGNVLFEYAALIVSRIEYYIDQADVALMTADTDYILLGITGNNSLTGLDIGQSEIYDRYQLYRNDLGAAANNTVHLRESPIVRDFSGMKGGGLLLPFKDISLAVDSQGLANPFTAACRIYYTLMELKAEDYLELTQRLNVLSN